LRACRPGNEALEEEEEEELLKLVAEPDLQLGLPPAVPRIDDDPDMSGTPRLGRPLHENPDGTFAAPALAESAPDAAQLMLAPGAVEQDE
jgi:hypothetical protein